MELLCHDYPDRPPGGGIQFLLENKAVKVDKIEIWDELNGRALTESEIQALIPVQTL